MPLTRSAARRSHRALSSDDVLSTVLSFLDPLAGFGAATTSKTLRDAWRRRCRGMLRVHRQRIGEFTYSDHCVAYGDGVMVPDYSFNRDSGSLKTYAVDGRHLSDLNMCLNTPRVVALRGDGTAWVLLSDDRRIICVRLAEAPSAPSNEILRRTRDATDAYNEVLMSIVITSAYNITTFTLAGDKLLVLFVDAIYPEIAMYIGVYDNTTGTFLREFPLEDVPGEESWRERSCIAVQGDMLYIARQLDDTVDVYNWREGTLMRRFGGEGEGQRLSFNQPFGIALRGKTMYVSEVDGRRIQVIRLSDDDYSEPDVLQVIPSPDGARLGGLCLSGDWLWCVGPKYPREELEMLEATYVHVFGPCYPE